MTARKVTVSITVQVLHFDAARTMICNALTQLDNKILAGSLIASDGDQVDWTVSTKRVEF